MSEEIVRRLRSRCQESLRFIKDSLPVDGEEVEEEEVEDPDTEEEVENTPDEEVSPDEQDTAPEQGPMPSRGSSAPTGDIPDEEDVPAEDATLELERDSDKDNINPLDNQYAVKFGLGERVAIAYADGTATDAEATIEGYDGEGFYRIKLAGGMTINGLTDIALTSLVKGTNESKCICGSHEFITEGKHTVCDTCGRVLKEDNQLTILAQDKSKKRIIRAEQHPISTANKPDISESIRKAFNRKPIKEEEDIYSFAYLRKSLEGEFWTKLPELVADIEDLGYDVLDSNAEYVIVSSRDDNDEEMQIPLGGTSRTLTLDFKRARIV